MFRYSFFLLLIITQACSPKAVVEPLPSELTDIELFMSRGAFSTAEYETFKLQSDSIFVECGPVVGGRFQAREQNLIPLSQELFAEIKELAEETTALYLSRTWRLDEPGRANSFFDPGQFYLTTSLDDGTTVSLRTSLDSVSEPNSTIARKLRSLAIALRAVSDTPPCGARAFFGIPREDKRTFRTRISTLSSHTEKGLS